MDQQKLRNLVFEKTGVRVDSDDPIFALVALNEAVLAETVERHVALLDAAARELALQARAGTAAWPGTLPVAAGTPGWTPPRTLEPRLLGALAASAMLSALMVLAGQALWFKPQPAPVPGPAALTAQQAAAIRRAEKLEAAVSKLAPEARGRIEAEMKKP